MTSAISESLRPTYEKITPRAIKGDRVKHRVTFNLNKASPGETLRVAVPKLEDGLLLVPCTFALVFNLAVSGEENNFLVNNDARMLVLRLLRLLRLFVKFAGEKLQDTDAFDIYKLY